MKKILCCLFATLMCIFCFSACGGKNDSQNAGGSTQESKIEFVQNEIVLSVGDSVQAEVITSKKNVYISWSIRDEDLATVSEDGVITALAEGQTMCYAEFGGEKAICLIKVVAKNAAPMLSVSIPYNQDLIALYIGHTLNLKASAKLGDDVCADATILYAVADSAVATVENGVLTACGVGDTTLTITAEYAGEIATLSVEIQVVDSLP